MPTEQQFKQLNPPDLKDVTDESARDTKVGINKIQIGELEEFDSARQVATIRLVLKQVINIKPDGTRTIQEHPVILECPVMTNFGGSSHINLPVAKGDSCIVLFNDREIDEWLYNGGEQVPVSPRVHDVSDAIAIVGIRSYQNSIQNFLANGIRVWLSENSKMDFTDDAIDSLAGLFTHTGDMRIDGNFYVTGKWFGENGSQMIVATDLIQDAGFKLSDGRKVSGTFNTVTVEDGIVVGGS